MMSEIQSIPNKEKLIHIVQLIPNLNEGGVERGVVELNAHLVNHGFKSTVITASGKNIKHIVHNGGTVHRIDVASKNPFIFISSLFRLKKCLKQIKPDIIHARSRIPAWQAYIVNKSLNIPFITTVHGFNHISKYSEIMTKGDLVIAVSHPIREYIQTHYHIPSERIRIIHRGIDPDLFNPGKLDHEWIQSFKNQFGLNDTFIVSIVGRITELKDHPTFVRALERLKTKKNVKGLIVGGIPSSHNAYYNELKALISELDLEEDLIFTDSQTMLPEIYHISDVVISSSKKPESFGRTIIEALSMNTPVIASNHGGSLDIIPSHRKDLLFTPQDVADLFYKIDTYDLEARENFRDYIITHFSNRIMLNEICDTYKELLKNSQANRS
jgi:glycosyltransferase involved in cell wall biosynthesis